MSDFNVHEEVEDVARVQCNKEDDGWVCEIYDNETARSTNEEGTDIPSEFQDPDLVVDIDETEMFDGRRGHDDGNIDEVLTSMGEYDVSYYFSGDMGCQVVTNEDADNPDENLFCTGKYAMKTMGDN